MAAPKIPTMAELQAGVVSAWKPDAPGPIRTAEYEMKTNKSAAYHLGVEKAMSNTPPLAPAQSIKGQSGIPARFKK